MGKLLFDQFYGPSSQERPLTSFYHKVFRDGDSLTLKLAESCKRPRVMCYYYFQMKIPKLKSILTVFIFLTVFAMNYASLLKFPGVFVDEPWLISRAWMFLKSGILNSSLDLGVIDKYNGYWTTFPWVPNLFQAISYLRAPEPTLLPARVVSLLFGMALLGCIYFSAKKLSSQKAAILSVLVLAASPSFITNSHLARYDIMVAFWGYLSLLLFLHDPSLQSILLGFLSGLAMGLAVETHLYGGIFIPAIALLYWSKLKGKIIANRSAIGFAFGGIVSMLGYAWLHFRYPQTYSKIMALIYSSTHMPPLFTFDAKIIWTGLTDLGWQVLIYFPFIMLFCVLALAFIGVRNKSEDRLLLIFCVSLALSYALFIRNKSSYYFIYLAPGLAMLIGYFMVEFYRRDWSGTFTDYINRMAWLSLAISLLFSIGMLRSLFATDWYTDYLQINNRITSSLVSSDAIMGPQTYWLGNYKHKYYSWQQLIYYQRDQTNSSLEDALFAMKPDVLILDNQVFILDENAVKAEPYAQFASIPADELNEYLSMYGRLLDDFESISYGQINIYRLDWSNQSKASP